jgi:hypothetical protein
MRQPGGSQKLTQFQKKMLLSILNPTELLDYFRKKKNDCMYETYIFIGGKCVANPVHNLNETRSVMTK